MDLIVTSPPYALELPYIGGDVLDYPTWLHALESWLAELLRVAKPDSGRLCLNVPLDRDLGGWEPVSGMRSRWPAPWAGISEPGCCGTKVRPVPVRIAAAWIPLARPTLRLRSSQC